MQSYLVIQAARFGDLVQTKRLILSLEKKGEVHLCIDRSLRDLAKILYPFAVIHDVYFHGIPDISKIKFNKNIFSNLIKIPFNQIYNCNFSNITAVICRMFENENIIGYRPSNIVSGVIERSPWIRFVFELSKQRSITPLNLVDFWGNFVDCPIDACEVNPIAKSKGNGMGVVLAGRESRRSLPVDVLSKIILTMQNAFSYKKIYLFGTDHEQKIAHELYKNISPKIQNNIENLCGKTDWINLIEYLEGLDIVLTPDTGTMHLACHLGVPVLAFFLSSAWCHETGPYGDGHMVWQANCNCTPCIESNSCFNNMLCLQAFKNDNFLRNLIKVFDQDHTNGLSLENLLFLKSTTDDLGGKFVIKYGNDKFLESRLSTRAIISRFLHIENKYESIMSIPILDDYICDDKNWMLPPMRYF